MSLFNIFKNKTKIAGDYFLVIDIGTTGVKGFVFNKSEEVIAKSYRLLKKSERQPNWVEQDPHELYTAVIFVIRNALTLAGLTGKDISACGLTNQRETIIAWDARNNMPVYPAIVWEDMRTKEWCASSLAPYQELIREKTGLMPDPYFSASKMRWILKNVAQAEAVNREGALRFGTVDAWILWNLTDGEVFATDETNASRTLLFDIRNRAWSSELLKIFGLNLLQLPEVKLSQADYGFVRSDIMSGRVPIRAVCGDQQSSAVAAGLRRGQTKITYGTGTFIMQMLGEKFELHHGWFTTLVPGRDKPNYALEGKIACCGKKIAPLLKDPVRLKPVLLNLAQLVADDLNRLPYSVKEVTADGGVTQSEFMMLNQAELANIKIKQHKIHDGTALGVLRLLLNKF